jgi:hypothetical protein
MLATADFAPNQAGALEDTDVLRHRDERDLEAGRQVSDPSGRGREARNQVPADGVGQGSVGRVEGHLVILNQKVKRWPGRRGGAVLWLDDILARAPIVNGRLHHGGGGDRVELICGGFAIEQLTARPLLESLPTVVHLRGHAGAAPNGWPG